MASRAASSAKVRVAWRPCLANFGSILHGVGSIADKCPLSAQDVFDHACLMGCRS